MRFSVSHHIFLTVTFFQFLPVCIASPKLSGHPKVKLIDTLPGDYYAFKRRDLRFRLGDETEVRIAFSKIDNESGPQTYIQWGPINISESFEQAKRNRVITAYPLGSFSISDDKREILLHDGNGPPDQEAAVKITLKSPFDGQLRNTEISRIQLYLGGREIDPDLPRTLLPPFRQYHIVFEGSLAKSIANVIKKAEGTSSGRNNALDALREEGRITGKLFKYLNKNSTYFNYRQRVGVTISRKIDLELATFLVMSPIEARIILSGLRALGLDPGHPIFSALEMAPSYNEPKSCLDILSHDKNDDP